MEFTINLKLSKVTKGALQYVEVDDNGEPRQWGYKVGTLYLRKEATQGNQPAVIAVTVVTS